MLSKDIFSKNSSTTEWVIGNPSRHIRAGIIKERTIGRDLTMTVRIFSTTPYELDDWRGWQATIDAFKVAPSSSKNKGYIVELDDHSGRMYRVIPAKMFVDTLASMEQVWANSEKAQAAREAERARLQNIREAAVAQAQVKADTLRDSLETSLQRVLGKCDVIKDVSVRVTGDWDNSTPENPVYRAKHVGAVTLSSNDFQRLLEKLYEAQDALV